MSSVSNVIKNNTGIKKIVHWMIVPRGEARPRTWVKWLVNPFFHKRKKGSTIRRRTRIDSFPFNKFELGKHSVIEDFSTVNNGVGDVIIGDRSLIGIGSVLIGPIFIGNNVIIAQNVIMSGLNHKYLDVSIPISEQGVSMARIAIGDDCWIAANAVITAGVSIGQHSVIAAGAVVTKDIPPYCVAAGNPATVIKRYDFKTESWVRI